ncbi:hypothetical protein ACQR1Y_12030 [Bradyrhizobium sp. HKCCYLRH3099]|uniref:hypothetical protein n=1 Tax=unclassified Bradyrhizobium TaxID=2631580 RepID=UPI003EBD3398
MSFEEITKRDSAPQDSGVRVSFRKRRSDGKLVCVVGLRAGFLKSSGFGDAAAYRLGVGRDEDAGTIALWPDVSGPFIARKAHGARCLDLGHIATLSMAVPCKARACPVELRDGRAVITLPGADDGVDASGDVDDADTAEAAPSLAPVAADRAPPPPTPPRKGEGSAAASVADKPRPIVRSPADIVEFPDLTVDLADGHERIIRNGDSVDVSPRGARLVVALAKAMPNCVGDDFLLSKLWDKKPAAGSASLDMVIADLKGLQKLGLDIRTQRGIGRQLVVRA